MLAVIGLLLTALGVLIFEALRVLSKLPGSGNWLRSAGASGTAIILVMAFVVTGVGLLARFSLDFKMLSFDAIDGVESAAIVVVTGYLLHLVYAKRRRSSPVAAAMPEVPTVGVVGASVAMAAAGAVNDLPQGSDGPASGAGGKGKKAA